MIKENDIKMELPMTGKIPLDCDPIADCCENASLRPIDERCREKEFLRRKLSKRLEEDQVVKIQDACHDLCGIRKNCIEIELKLETDTDPELLKILCGKLSTQNQLYNFTADELKYLIEKSKK